MHSNEIIDTQNSPEPVPTAILPNAINPDDPHWGIGLAFVVWLASVAAILFIPSFFLIPYVLSSGVDLSDGTAVSSFAMSDKTAIIIQIASIIPAHLLTLLLAWAVVTRFGKKPFFASLGWTFAGVRWWHYVLMLIGFYILIAIFTTVFPLKPDQMDLIIKSSRTAMYVVAIMAVLSAPIVEEVVYRGILYSGFQKHVGKIASIIVVTVLFTLVHVPQYFENPSKILVLTALSLGLTLLRAYTGSLLPSVILHTLINGLQSAALIAEPYITNPATSDAINNIPK